MCSSAPMCAKDNNKNVSTHRAPMCAMCAPMCAPGILVFFFLAVLVFFFFAVFLSSL